MPPRTRSGHAEKLAGQALLKSGRANVSGLAAAPTEILVNIISHFSCIPIPYTEVFRSYFPHKFLERLETLQALSKTCRRLRSVVLPILWEKIEVAVRKHKGKDRGFGKRLATELVRQLEIVTIRDPTLASCVQEVSICLSGYSSSTVFAELVRALHMFPNMRTLQIYTLSSQPHNEIIKACSGHTFPSVKTLTVEAPTHTLVKSFPQAETYYLINCYVVSYCWDAMIKYGGPVTKISGLPVPDMGTLASIVTALPHLSYLEMWAGCILIPNGFLDMVPLLQLLKNLQVIRLIINQYATGEQYATVKANVALVLTKLQKHHIIIEYRGGVNGELRNFEERFESSSAVIPGD